jgi:hypothetical protein
MYVLGSTGELIPIVGRVITDITSNNIKLGRTLIYLVKDTKEQDIICELIIGRASLANGPYPCIDMRERGMIYHPSSNEKIPCIPCIFEKDTLGVSQIKPIHQHEKRQTVNRKDSNEKILKVNTLRVMVNERNDINQEHKEQLFTHLLLYR